MSGHYARMCDALSAVTTADFEMAIATHMLRQAGRPDLEAEATALFEQLLAFRGKVEAATRPDGPPEEHR